MNLNQIKKRADQEFDAKFKPSLSCRRCLADDFSQPCTCVDDEINKEVHAKQRKFLSETLDRLAIEQKLFVLQYLHDNASGIASQDAETVIKAFTRFKGDNK